MSTASLQAIYIKTAKRGPMLPTDRAEVREGQGIAGNANQGGRRQVTILEQEKWEAAMDALEAGLPAHARRANLLVRGIRLTQATGRVLRIGGARVRILGETKPCPRMDEALPGLKDVLKPDWGGGAYGEVLTGGEVVVGAPVSWEDDPSGDAPRPVT
jgi:MOSC domain-containing protein YiiM